MNIFSRGRGGTGGKSQVALLDLAGLSIYSGSQNMQISLITRQDDDYFYNVWNVQSGDYLPPAFRLFTIKGVNGREPHIIGCKEARRPR